MAKEKNMPLELWVTLGLLPFAFAVGRMHRRRINGGKGYTMIQQMKHLGFMAAILGLLLAAAWAFADAPKPPPIASAAKGGNWRLSTKEIALPQGPLCSTHATIWAGRHVTLKVAGAQMFEATLAIVRPQHKRGNILTVYVDQEERESVQIQYGQNPVHLRIPIPPGAQTLTLVEAKPFPKITLCSPSLS
jgi:hypothetical protein